MRIKFTVGMSEAEEDRLRLEEQRHQSSQWNSLGDEDPESRPPGWPAAPDGPDDEIDRLPVHFWAW